MQRRTLGRTGLELSLIGFGGFHLIEVPRGEAARLLNAYLDAGGNYIETAAGYGDGISERKIGEAVSQAGAASSTWPPRSVERTRAGALRDLEASLRRLRTDHVDLFFIHALQKVEEAEQVLAPGGALEAVEEARRSGKVRFVAVSGHGRPAALLHAVRRHRFDALMTGMNYFDRFNFPQVEEELLPLCLRQGTGLLGMKALADGYLHRSAPQALRYTLGLPVASLVVGINRQDQLEQALAAAERFTPMSAEEKAGCSAARRSWATTCAGSAAAVARRTGSTRRRSSASRGSSTGRWTTAACRTPTGTRCRSG